MPSKGKSLRDINKKYKIASPDTSENKQFLNLRQQYPFVQRCKGEGIKNKKSFEFPQIFILRLETLNTKLIQKLLYLDHMQGIEELNNNAQQAKIFLSEKIQYKYKFLVY